MIYYVHFTKSWQRFFVFNNILGHYMFNLFVFFRPMTIAEGQLLTMASLLLLSAAPKKYCTLLLQRSTSSCSPVLLWSCGDRAHHRKWCSWVCRCRAPRAALCLTIWFLFDNLILRHDAAIQETKLSIEVNNKMHIEVDVIFVIYIYETFLT